MYKRQLVARSGGVLERAGHTEASVDISKLSKLNPSAVICEVMNQDGRMARLNDLKIFAKKHKLKIASIEDIISFRLKNEKLIKSIKIKNITLKKQKYDFLTYKNYKSFILKILRFNSPSIILYERLFKLY